MLTAGNRCKTADGFGVVVKVAPYGNAASSLRLGVKHDVYPKNRVAGLYKDDVLYYFPHEVQGEVQTASA
jgi:hypothetical protein